ncbi:hypothetical protein AB0K51_31205 [Kitasatospora sp. NPDC049285]|uniref:hypothetical protein n=1 Tax=Kitasatospora sp. NPDC049285 TaxID=3157096 RepID=UPI00341B2F7A
MVLLAAPVASTIAADTARWNQFFADWVRPMGVVVIVAAIVLAVLIALSGLLTRVMVSCRADAWKSRSIWCWAAVGGAAMLAVGALATVYPMFAPFHDALWLVVAFPLGVVLPGVVLVALAHGLRWNHGHFTRPRFVMPSGTALALALLWTGLLAYFLTAAHEGRLIVAGVGLVVLGVTAVSTALGQSLRIQVEAQDPTGAADPAASDYVLSRLQHLSTKPVDKKLGISRASELSKLLSEDLSAMPAGNIAGAVAKILYAIRPGLTWRARVTTVDRDRVTVTLTRNGMHAFSALVSRPELGLPAIPPDAAEPALTEATDRARAQLLTGAAACVLVGLSKGHREVSRGLCGAKQWTAVALHVIAADPALVNDPPLQRALLRQAVHIQPGYGPARFDYLTAQFVATSQKPEDRLRFARLLAPLIALAKDENGDIEYGWEAVYLESLYSQIALWIGAYLGEHGRPDRRKITKLMESEPKLVSDAEAATAELTRACDDLDDRCEQESRRFDTGELRRYIGAMKKTSELIGDILKLIRDQERHRGPRQSTWKSPVPEPVPSPELAYSYARLAALIRHCGLRPGELGELEDHLAFAIATEKDRRNLRADPSFAELLRRRKLETMDVIGIEERLGMLELPPFAPFADRLRAAGLTSFAALMAGTSGGADRQELANYLEVSPLRAGHLIGIAQLSKLHEDLSRPEVVKVFLDVGVTCLADLQRRVRENDSWLTRRLRRLAVERDLSAEPAFAQPARWHEALERWSLPSGRADGAVRADMGPTADRWA